MLSVDPRSIIDTEHATEFHRKTTIAGNRDIHIRERGIAIEQAYLLTECGVDR